MKVNGKGVDLYETNFKISVFPLSILLLNFFIHFYFKHLIKWTKPYYIEQEHTSKIKSIFFVRISLLLSLLNF